VGEIFGLLPLPDGVTNHEEGMELFTTEEPYGAMRHVNVKTTGETVYQDASQESYMDGRWFRIHGMIFLALVDNADFFSYAIHPEGTPNGYLEKRFTRDDAKMYFGDKDLREFAKDEETFMNFVSAINRYFYEGITKPEQINSLMEAEDAQLRMNDMLNKAEKPEVIADTGIEGVSMTYQMIHADSLLYHIANEQKLTSSNPLDYINCLEYEELVKIGEPALREFLATFAEGHAGEGLEAYIMMFACQDILGESRRPDLKPTEWYQLYAALDSTLAVNFAYDKLVYTKELEKNYGMGMNHVDACSIIRAGEDDRIKAVYDAIENRYNPEGIMLSHETSIYAPYIYEIREEGKRMQVFTTIFEERYVLTRTKQGYGFFERGGSVVPTRLDFEKQYGKWVLQEWTEAEDGSRYSDSIEEMCNGDTGLAKVMMVGGEYHMLMWQNLIYYMNAHYSGNIPVYISSYTDDATLKEVGKYIRVVPMFN